MAEWISIGKVVSVNYSRRELRISPMTEHLDRFEGIDEVRLEFRDGTQKVLTADSARVAGRNICVTVSASAGLDSMNGLKGARVVVSADDRYELPDGEYYYDDIVGSDVRDGDGRSVGKISAVYPMATHHDIYEVTAGDGTEYLVAAVDSAVLNVDVAARTVTIESAALVRQDGHAR